MELAAIYAAGISANHPFIDGNKRVAFVAMGQFLDDNGLELTATPDDATQIMLRLARGEIGIGAATEWLRDRVRPIAAFPAAP